jgi:hypothetical protein
MILLLGSYNETAQQNFINLLNQLISGKADFTVSKADTHDDVADAITQCQPDHIICFSEKIHWFLMIDMITTIMNYNLVL